MADEADRRAKIEKLQASAAAQEALRGVLDDEIIETSLAAINAQIAALEDRTGGGATFARDIDTGGGDFIGRDQNIHGDVVGGDKVGGDKIAVGDISGSSGLAIGRGAQAIQAHIVHIYGDEVAEEDLLPLEAYLRTTARHGNRLPLAPLDPSGQESAYLSLAQVFVGLDAGPAERPAAEPGSIIRYTAALGHIHDNRRLILLGDPGSGKTTLLRFISLCLARAANSPDEAWLKQLVWPQYMIEVPPEDWRGHLARAWRSLTGRRAAMVEESDQKRMLARQLGEEAQDEPELVHWTSGAPLPIFVTLRDFARETFDPNSPLAIWQHVARRLVTEGLPDAVEPLRRRALAGQVIFLLDGVDETPLADRPAVWRAVAALAKGPYGDNRWVATCRVLSFVESEVPPGIPEQTLQPLGEEQIKAFIGGWYDALAESGELGREMAQSLTTNLVTAAERPSLRPLAQNPMLLTIMALVQTYHGTLPDERAKLYQACVETLLLRWQRHKEKSAEGAHLPEPLAKLGAKQEALERLLWEIAWTAHNEAAGRDEAADIPESQVMDIARRQLGSYSRAEVFMEYTERRAHLLIGRGGPD